MRGAELRAERLEACLLETLDCFDRMAGEFRDRVEDLKLVFDVNRNMTELLDADRLLPEMVKLVASRMDVERCSVMLLDETGQSLYVKVGLGFDRPVEELTPSRVGQGISGKVAETGEPLLIKNIATDRRFRKQRGRNYKNDSLLCVPLKNKGTVIGVLNVNNKRDGTFFTESDLELLSILAGAAAVSLSNAALHRQTRQTMRYLNNVVENIDTGLMAVDAKGRVALLNRAFKRLFQLDDRPNALPCALRSLLPEGAARYFHRIVERTWREGDQRDVEVDIDCGKGRKLPADVGTLLLRDDSLQFQSQLVIVHDLSQSRELVKLRQLDTMKDNFISTVSHELRTPLTSMLASLSLIQQGFVGEVAPPQAELLTIIRRNAERLKALINDLLDLSRLESGRTQVNLEKNRSESAGAGLSPGYSPSGRGEENSLDDEPAVSGDDRDRPHENSTGDDQSAGQRSEIHSRRRGSDRGYAGGWRNGDRSGPGYRAWNPRGVPGEDFQPILPGGGCHDSLYHGDRSGIADLQKDCGDAWRHDPGGKQSRRGKLF